jgi:hypothetical protein
VGANYPGQEKAITELRALSPAAKEFLGHHIRNELTKIIGGIKVGKLQIADDAAWHIVEDLEKIGC